MILDKEIEEIREIIQETEDAIESVELIDGPSDRTRRLRNNVAENKARLERVIDSQRIVERIEAITEKVRASLKD